jgi:hypothetical protein
MKYFRIEPTYKKSLVEHYVFRRPLSDLTDDGPEGNIATLTKEIGWRWGDFIATVPETEDEITEWLSYRDDGAYSNFYDLAIDYGLTETDENGEEVLPPSKSIQEMIEGLLLPDLDDDFVQITEDYPEAEMQSTWDGCWEDWTLNTGYKGPELENLESIIEEVEEAYCEDYEEGVEALGWVFGECEYEMHCRPMITQIYADGEAIGEPMQSESDE